MKKLRIALLVCLFVCVGISQAQAALIDLYDWGFNIDGTTVDSLTLSGGVGYYAPAGGDFAGLGGSIDTSAFDFSNGYQSGGGLGSLSITITGAGVHFVGAFFDHEIDEAINGFSNETGSVSGSPAVGQAWEIDEPGYVNGDIFENFQSSALDNGIGTSVYGDTSFPEDVSVAMGWNFSLNAGDTATIDFILSDLVVPAGFYLTHADPDSSANIYFSGNLTVTPGGEVPEPCTMLLLGTGVLGLLGLGRKKFKKITFHSSP